MPGIGPRVKETRERKDLARIQKKGKDTVMEKLIDTILEKPQLFQVLIDNMPSPVYYKDTDGIYLIYNRAFREYFGLPDEQCAGKSVFELPIGHDEAMLHHKMDQELLQSPGVCEYESAYTRPDGSVRHELVKKATFSGTDGTIGGIVGVIIDITDRRKMEEDILKAKNLKSLGTLAGGIAHDFNNLLMAIVGNISLAKMNAPDDPAIMGYLKEAERIAFMGKSLTQQLLTFSRGGDPVRTIVRPGPLVVKIAEKVLGASCVQRVYDIPDDILPIEADEGQFAQVVENVLVNAKEAMPEGGKVTVQIRNMHIPPEDRLPLIKEDYVRISIADEGSGIAKEDLSKIFDPYYTTKDMGSQKGVGLGLAICFAIVKKHNGHISVESAEGGGTIFHVHFPAYKQAAAEEATHAGHSKLKHKGRVLILDDEEMILKIGEELLRHLGYEATPARSGEEAIDLYRQAMELKSPFNAVVLDLAIPNGIGGKEVLGELVRIDPMVKAIISSGYLNDPIVSRFGEYGFLDVLTKPYDAVELDEKLQKIISQRSNDQFTSNQ